MGSDNNLNGWIIGYDPGGNGKHGVAALKIVNADVCGDLKVGTEGTVADVIAWIEKRIQGEAILAAGIDTLTAWSKGRSGWRDADLRLIDGYVRVRHSVGSANSLQGSMCLNGALLIQWLREKHHGTMVTEAHPKVLYFALSDQLHPGNPVPVKKASPQKGAESTIQRATGAEAWAATRGFFKERFGFPEFDVEAEDHVLDAILGVLTAWEGVKGLAGLEGGWTMDLHAADKELIHPFGKTHYWWPKSLGPASVK